MTAEAYARRILSRIDAFNLRLATTLTIGAVFISLWIYCLTIAISPPDQLITTRHELDFIPAKYSFADKVTNVFSESRGVGGAGGVGLPQVDYTLSRYGEMSSKEEHTLVYEKSQGQFQGRVHFYDFYPNKVLHAQWIIPKESYGIWGEWVPASIKIEGREIVINRSYSANGGFLAALGLVCVILWLLFSAVIILTLEILYSHLNLRR